MISLIITVITVLCAGCFQDTFMQSMTIRYFKIIQSPKISLSCIFCQIYLDLSGRCHLSKTQIQNVCMLVSFEIGIKIVVSLSWEAYLGKTNGLWEKWHSFPTGPAQSYSCQIPSGRPGSWGWLCDKLLSVKRWTVAVVLGGYKRQLSPLH